MESFKAMDQTPTEDGVDVKFVAAPVEEKLKTEFFEFVMNRRLKQKLDKGYKKTTNNVHKSLLLLFEEGFYVDHRTVGKQVDCTKIIWVLAANQGEKIIQEYRDDHLAGKPEYAQLQIPIDSLQRSLEKNFQMTLGGPMIGRLSNIIPPAGNWLPRD
ncbi:MAG: hypothetical protein Q9209_002525 [Squamulea sp. 1 TL-2023]